MDVIGFTFGICGMTFGLLGMILAINALAKVRELESRVDKLS